MLNQAVYTLGSATATTVVPPTLDAGHYTLKNLQPQSDVGDYSRDGYAYAVSQYLTIANNGTALFSFTTGVTGAQFDFWTFTATGSNVLGELIEGATITTAGNPIIGYNLNRDFSDNHASVLKAATALTGGTVVLSELVPASNQAGGGVASSKTITLKANTEYGFRFTDVGGNGAKLHVQIGWVEVYNGYHDIWLGTKDDSFVLRGGEEVSMYIRPNEIINAVGGHDGCKLAVMRQD
jgi:hypothetical protein